MKAAPVIIVTTFKTGTNGKEYLNMTRKNAPKTNAITPNRFLFILPPQLNKSSFVSGSRVELSNPSKVVL